MQLDGFTQTYIICALWSSNDESTPAGGEPIDKNYGAEDLHPDTLARMVADCKKFQEENAALLIPSNYLVHREWTMLAHAGHDFWLTRNHHGAGFWDGDWEEKAGEALTVASQKFPECSLIVGDDGKIHQE